MASSLKLSRTMATPLSPGKNPGWWKQAKVIREAQEALEQKVRSLVREWDADGGQEIDALSFVLARLTESEQVLFRGNDQLEALVQKGVDQGIESRWSSR